MAEADQRLKIISLLETARKLSTDLDEADLAYLIERAIDEARAGAFPTHKVASYRTKAVRLNHVKMKSD